MLKEKIKYKNFNDEEVETVCYFHLGIPELVEMEISETGGLSRIIEQMVDEQDNKKLIEFVKRLILDSYGVKSPDGMSFEKSDDLLRKFSQTAAYEALYAKLSQDAEACVVFINGMMPAEVLKQVEAEAAMKRALGESAGAATGVGIVGAIDIPTTAPTLPPVVEDQGTWTLPPSVDPIRPPGT